MVPNLQTATVWGTLPGATDETIYIVAHRDGWFDSAVDNASGVATLLALAEYYSKIPQAQRRRTIHFIGSSGHHSSRSGVSGEWFAARPDLFKTTALIMNCEHTGPRQTFHGSMRPGNAPILMRWFAHDERMAAIVRDALDTFGIGTFYESDPRGVGEAGRYYHYAPMAQILGDGGGGGWYAFHTDQETPGHRLRPRDGGHDTGLRQDHRRGQQAGFGRAAGLDRGTLTTHRNLDPFIRPTLSPAARTRTGRCPRWDGSPASGL